jgi:hypothetical protein
MSDKKVADTSPVARFRARQERMGRRQRNCYATDEEWRAVQAFLRELRRASTAPRLR